jgi:hypothetical protein
MSAPNPVLSNLRSRARSALLKRNAREALEALKQLLAVEPADADALANLQSLRLNVNREIESIEKRLGIVAGNDSDGQHQLLQELDRRLPHWRGFTEEIPRLKSLLSHSEKGEVAGLEEELRRLLKSGSCAEALHKWLSEGSPKRLDGKLALVFSSLADIQTAEAASEVDQWRGALAEFDRLADGSSVDEIEWSTAWVAGSRWRLKVSDWLNRAESLSNAPKSNPAAASRILEQLSFAEEELRVKPALAGGQALQEQLAQARSSLQSAQKLSSSRFSWAPPLIFMALLLVAAAIWRFNATRFAPAEDQPAENGPTVLPWRPKPEAGAINPKPLDDDVLLPMPNDWGMAFRKIYVRGQNHLKPWSFESGAPGAIQTYQIWAPFEDSEGYYYLLGKYEVTQGQFAQFTQLPQDGNANSRLPMTNINTGDVEDFCNRYSIWLGQQSQLRLPASASNKPARCRLPTCAEWLFAAKGAASTHGTEGFARPWPWEGQASGREWHAGHAAGRLHPIGVLAAHPLGLFDMLGNAREFAIESTAAREKFWMVGNDYSTREEQLSADSRMAVPALASDKNEPFRQPEQGFRIILSAEPDTFQQPER